MIPSLVLRDDRIVAQIDRMGPDVKAALEDALRPLAASMAADAQARARAHIRFNGKKPGQYLASIVGGVSVKDARVLGYVRSGDPLAHIMEGGAQTPAHDILPSAADVLAFDGDAGAVFARVVHHPGAIIPPYPAIAPAFAARADEVRATIEKAVRTAAQQAGENA